MYQGLPATISKSYQTINITYRPEVTKNTHYVKHDFSISRKETTSRLFLQHTNNNLIWEEELSISCFIAYEKNVKSIENDLKVFVKAFENQRKMYKYAIAWNKYQNDIISDAEMDTLEESLAVLIDSNCSISETNKNMLSLFKYIKEDNFDLEELSNILGTPRKNISKLSSQITVSK